MSHGKYVMARQWYVMARRMSHVGCTSVTARNGRRRAFRISYFLGFAHVSGVIMMTMASGWLDLSGGANWSLSSPPAAGLPQVGPVPAMVPNDLADDLERAGLLQYIGNINIVFPVCNVFLNFLMFPDIFRPPVALGKPI